MFSTMSITTTPQSDIPYTVDDPINKRILAISEDKIQGFARQPFHAIAQQSGLELPLVLARLRAMLKAGTIRRIRQTLLSTSLSPGALVAWEIDVDKLNDAFDYLFEQDPFSGHVVIRTCDTGTVGSTYRLWTTLKVPNPYSLEKHCKWLCQKTGAKRFRLMPALKLFVLGVGHVRRRELAPGDRIDVPASVQDTTVIDLTEDDWKVLMTMKREFAVEELVENPWDQRAAEVGMTPEAFCAAGQRLNELGVIGRFSTFLEHVKKHQDGTTVTRYNALFHWAVPQGKEMQAGKEVGRHMCMTHAYWREGGPEFNNVNIMGVAHGLDKDLLLAHKAAIDAHLEEAGIPVGYTNVFWGGRSEIKPSEISPIAYRQWLSEQGENPEDFLA
jgi:DNA-binding Lrp family transcriptional regulator